MKLCILVAALCANIAFALSLPKQLKEKCTIHTKTTFKNGEVKELTSHPKAKNKTECENFNKTYSLNFSPKEVKDVKSTFKWSGK